MTLVEKVGVSIRDERLRKKMSQEAVAKRAGISCSYQSMIERGLRTIPIDTFVSIAKALRTEPATLLRSAA